MSCGRFILGRSLVRTLEAYVAGPVMCRLRTWWVPRERLRRAMNWTDLGAAIVDAWVCVEVRVRIIVITRLK
jgi:hypothetical protein